MRPFYVLDGSTTDIAWGKEMKKFILVKMTMAATALTVQADTRAKVQLWEGGPYWATTNIGADKPEDSGLYFWWGDTTGYRPSADGTFSFRFDFDNPAIYTYVHSASELQSTGWVTSDGLAPAHDAAHVQWGGSWRMPTYQELYDLCHTYCDWTWTTRNGVNGYVVRGRGAYASNSIFLPAAGLGSGTSLRYASSGSGGSGYYWSSSGPRSAYGLLFGSDRRSTGGNVDKKCGRSIRPVQGFGEGSAEEAVVSFNANGGTGTMESQAFEEGKSQKLSKNTYRKDGYVFQGWAVTANGEVVYKNEASITVESDMTLYAVWANPLLTLAAESANWGNGSITLKCEDSDTSNTPHKYSLEYKDESGVWTNVNDVAATNIARDSDGFAHLTDNTFWSRLGGLPPVEYRVRDESGRVSEGCVTRNRHGLFVGVGHYSVAYQAKVKLQLGRVLSDLPEIESNTRRYSSLAQSRGRFVATNLIETDAKVKMVDDALVDIAGNVIPGDVCLFYVSTHGDFNGTEAVLRLYDDDYSDSRLRVGIDLLAAKDAAVICVLAACCSEAMVRLSIANVAVIAAANYNGSTTALFDEILWDYGWNDGWAGNGGNVTFGELADYVEARYNAIFNGITLNGPYGPETWNVQIDNFPLLSKIMAGTRGTHISQSIPPVPSNINATKADHRDRIEVSWDGDPDTDNYFIFYGGTGGGVYEDFEQAEAECQIEFKFTFKTNDYECVEQSSENAPVPFVIRAFNGAGVSSAANRVDGWVDTKRTVKFKAKGGSFGKWRDKYPVFISNDYYVADDIEKGTAIGLLPTATKEGFICAYWYRDNSDRINVDNGSCEIATKDTIVTDDVIYEAFWTSMPQEWVDRHADIATASGGDIATAAAMTAANGCKTVGECFALGIDPEDPDDDLKIASFEIKNGKPVITLNHTEDGSGNSFLPRVKTFGKENLSDAEWREVPEAGDDKMRFFKVDVEMP